MSLWSLLFPDKATRARRRAEEAELAAHACDRRNTIQAVQSGTRLMKTYAGAMQMMARSQDEDR